jgi:hypothetical protein
MDHQQEQSQNEERFKMQIEAFRPDVYVLMKLLDDTGINPMVLIKIIRQLSDIAQGLKFGEVRVTIEKGQVTFIKGEQSDRVFEPLVAPFSIFKKDTN